MPQRVQQVYASTSSTTCAENDRLAVTRTILLYHNRAILSSSKFIGFPTNVVSDVLVVGNVLDVKSVSTTHPQCFGYGMPTLRYQLR
jgi:hypothetical protein